MTKFLLSLLLVLALSPPTVATTADPAWDGTLRRMRVPILMYHYISELPADADDIRKGLTVVPPLFQAHMQYLSDAGFTPISLYELNAALTTGAPLPPKPIVLTFDDGYNDAYTNVFPILKQYGFTGTFFIITARVDANDPTYVSWAQVKEMSDAGMSLESHTKDHFELRERDYDFLIYQLKGSLESLKAYTGRTPRMISYPVGRYDLAVLTVADELNAEIAVTTTSGDLQTTSGRLHLPRVRVLGNMSVAALASVLPGS